jgi:alcohol dehydrogenase
MAHSRSTHPAEQTDLILGNSTTAQLEVGSTRGSKGRPLAEGPLRLSGDEKTDAGALRDWESEGGAPNEAKEKRKAGSVMKALTYLGPGRRALETRPKPLIQATTDAIVRVTATTICGTDLHILKGDVPTVAPGRILGHEGVGIIEAVGASVSNFQLGAHVLISCITSCGKCTNCKKGMYSHCENGGGWVLGNVIDGTQAEYVRIPYADNSLYPIPVGVDEEALVMLSDILPTGFECGVLNGKVKPGDTVAIVGAGPIGLAALLTAQFYAPAEIIMIDGDENRLGVSLRFGATKVVSSTDGSAVERVMALTGNRGVDVAVEAVGLPGSFDTCQRIVAAGGHIANVGVHGKSVQLNLDKLWSHNITLTTALVDTVTTPMLLKTVASGKLQPKQLITHHFTLNEAMKAYDTFADAVNQRALKVIITNA